MLDPDFDPLQALSDLAGNQKMLMHNDQALSQAINQLRADFEEQSKVIDTLLKAIDTLNKTNELAMQQIFRLNKEHHDGQTVNNH